MSRGGIADDKCVFLGGLALSSVWHDVHDYLIQFGPVANLYLPYCKKTGTIKGYAKASFASADSVTRLLARSQHIIGGRCVGISLWKKKAEYAPLKAETRLRKVHVRCRGGLSENEIRDCFAGYGKVEAVDMRFDPMTQVSRRFCYVIFESVESAQEVARIRKHMFSGVKLICEMSKPETSSPVTTTGGDSSTRNKHSFKSEFSRAQGSSSIFDSPIQHPFSRNIRTLEDL